MTMKASGGLIVLLFTLVCLTSAYRNKFMDWKHNFNEFMKNYLELETGEENEAIGSWYDEEDLVAMMKNLTPSSEISMFLSLSEINCDEMQSGEEMEMLLEVMGESFPLEVPPEVEKYFKLRCAMSEWKAEVKDKHASIYLKYVNKNTRNLISEVQLEFDVTG